MIFKNGEHSLEPGETPSNTRLQTMFNVTTQRLTRLQTMFNFLNITQKIKSVQCGCGSVSVIFFNLLIFNTVINDSLINFSEIQKQ